MTGFAFYSCEDVVDNPAQDPAQSWNYSVSVKFENFTGVTYQAPTTLYVINEENTLMGTITTDAAPAAGDYGTYAGTLTGSIGNNLTITTKIGNDLAKQDGTLASAVENGIVQTADVPIKIYNANSGTLTTAAAKLENTSAIVKFKTNELFASDKLTFTAKDQAFEIAINEEFDPTVGILYAAVPATGTDKGDITIAATSKDGFMRGYTLNGENYPVTKGVVTDYSAVAIPFEKTGVDLTVWDANCRKENDWSENATTSFSETISDGKTFVITQSGEKSINTDVTISGNEDEEVALTLNNIRLKKYHSFQIQNGATFNLTLIGENEFDRLNLNSPYVKKGTGTWAFNELNIGGSFHFDGENNVVVDYAAEYTIDEDMELTHMSVYSGGKLTIADNKKVNITSKNDPAVSIYFGTLKVGKGATLKAESKLSNNHNVIKLESGTFDIGDNATVIAQGGKNGTALAIECNNDKQKAELNVGKLATVDFIGGPEGTIGYGITVQVPGYQGTTVNIKLDEGAKLTATGIDRAGINFFVVNWSSGSSTDHTVNISLAKDATITTEDTGEQGMGMNSYLNKAAFNITGEGSIEAKSAAKAGIYFGGYSCSYNIKGCNISAIGGTDMPGMTLSAPISITKDVKSFKATTGMTTDPLYISDDQSEAKEIELKDLVGEANVAKFNDAIADGIRTITPKPAEK